MPRQIIGLKGNTQVTVDSSLSFLNSHVSKALSGGARKYNPPNKSILSNLDLPKENPIKYEPYSNTTPHNNENSKAQQGKAGTGLIVKGKSHWTEKGYIGEEKPKPQPTEVKHAISITAQAMSSSDFVNKIGSNITTTSMNSKTFERNPANSTFEPTSLYQQKEDPSLANKQKLASNLFKGLGGSSGGMFEGISMKKPAPKGPAPKANPVIASQNVVKNPVQVNVPQNKETDLLDLFGDDEPKPVQVNTQPKPQANQELSSSSLLQGLKTKAPQKLPSNPTIQASPFSPQILSLEDYEQYWESWSDELISTFKGCISTLEQFKNFVSKLNIRIIEVIDNEVIVGGKYSDSSIVLLYGVFESNGDLELRIKAQNDSIKPILMNKCKELLGK